MYHFVTILEDAVFSLIHTQQKLSCLFIHDLYTTFYRFKTSLNITNKIQLTRLVNKPILRNAHRREIIVRIIRRYAECNRGFTRHCTYLCAHDFVTPLGFLFVRCGIEKKTLELLILLHRAN